MKDDPLNRIKVKRGSQLPQAKLHERDVSKILEIVDRREHMKRTLSQMTNAKIAELFGVSVRTIDRVTAGFGWTHVQ